MFALFAGDRPPRYGEKTPPFDVGRGPVPRHRPRYGKTSLVLFRSVGPETPLLTMEIAGDRPPRYGAREVLRAIASRPGGRAYGEDASNIKRLKRMSNTEAPGITLFVFM